MNGKLLTGTANSSFSKLIIVPIYQNVEKCTHKKTQSKQTTVPDCGWLYNSLFDDNFIVSVVVMLSAFYRLSDSFRSIFTQKSNFSSLKISTSSALHRKNSTLKHKDVPPDKIQITGGSVSSLTVFCGCI